MSEPFDLSLAIPCYNEGTHLRQSVAALIDVLRDTSYSFEILLVDDKSTDNTADVVKDLCDEHPCCRGMFHEKNMGRGAAFKTGFKNTSGRITGFIDIDLEVGAHYIPSLVQLIDREGYDIATGHRHYLLRQTGFIHRHVLSLAYRFICFLLIGLQVKDSETGCKFFRRDTAKKVILDSTSDGWFWDTEVMSRACLENLRIIEMPVVFARRYDKQSTVRLLPAIIEYLKAIYSFRKDVGLSLADRSPIYWTGIGYDITMRTVLGSGYEASYRKIADLIPENSSVVDVCGGTAHIYKEYLKAKGVDYMMLDASGHFVMSAINRGVNARLTDILSDPIPSAEYVIICSSFYHFHKEQDAVFRKLYAAAEKALIISEPVENLSNNRNLLLGKLANALTAPGAAGDYTFRYSERGFRAFAEKNNVSAYHRDPEDRNAIAVFTRTRQEIH